MTVPTEAPSRIAIRLTLYGQVQGRGVRPAVARLAKRLGLSGTVRNTAAGVVIIAEAEHALLEQFRRELANAIPDGCRLDGVEDELTDATGRHEFDIVRETTVGPLQTLVPPDVVVCERCLEEVRDPENRRHRYPCTSCATCGPRYTIISTMPYERPETTMAGFALCGSCETEYAQPNDRRYHAQTTACRECGPQVWAVGIDGRIVARDEQALSAAIATLRRGEIVALRGVGGYQLLCDAGNEVAVRRLRSRKGRPAKPFAVMVGSVADAARFTFLSETERAALTDASNPIVLLERRNTTAVCPAVFSGLDTLGLMLPSTPLHDLIIRGFRRLSANQGWTNAVPHGLPPVGFETLNPQPSTLNPPCRPLVCTSANREGEPLEFQIDDSERRLAGIAELWLHHDRPIERAIDDSVVRVIANRPVTVRLARGLAPLSLSCSLSRPTLALGGHMKMAAAWSNGSQCVLGPHIGDMETAATRAHALALFEDWQRLYRFAPAQIVHDEHPEYFTSRYAVERRLPAIAVQHHFAHVAGGMLEHGLLDDTVLGVAWDGTGYGSDGTIWGGEFLVVDAARRFQRVAHLRPFRLPGGEAAIREPWRVAVSILSEAVGADAILREGLAGRRARFQTARGGIDGRCIAPVLQTLERPRLSHRTTSAGRLFDAAAVLILGIERVDYEGEAAMLLEAIADRSSSDSRPGRFDYPLPLSSGTPAAAGGFKPATPAATGGLKPATPAQLDWRPLFAAMWEDRRAGIAPGTLAFRFHRTLAAGIVAVSQNHPGLPVVLAGGVFQNRLLTELVVELLNDAGRLYLPGRIPPNDGGLSAGQLAVASQME